MSGWRARWAHPILVVWLDQVPVLVSVTELAAEQSVLSDEDCLAPMAHHHGAVAFAFAFPCLLVGVPVDLCGW